jgi:phosphohistidine phosphatase
MTPDAPRDAEKPAQGRLGPPNDQELRKPTPSTLFRKGAPLSGRVLQKKARERLRALAASLDRAAKLPSDAESIHRLRVSIRRFTQVLRVYNGLFSHTRKMRRRLKGLMDLCGAARNCDIAAEVLAAAGVPIDPALEKHLQQRRARAGRELAKLLTKGATRGGMRHWRKWLTAKSGDAAPVPEVAPSFSHRFLAAGAAAAKAGAGAEQMHKFRLLAKRYRYTLEILGEKSLASVDIETLRGLQERLGAINDCVTTAQLVDDIGLNAPRTRKIKAALDRLRVRRAAGFRAYWREAENQIIPENQTMKICILRHAEAELRGPGVAEAERRLTPEGKRELRSVLRLARDAGVEPDVILASPWTRALETAMAARDAFGVKDVIETKSLLPDVLAARIWGEIRSLRPLKEIMVVGHEPHLSRLAAFLLEAPVAIDMKKAAIIRIDVQEREGPPRGVLKWMMTPKVASGK